MQISSPGQYLAWGMANILVGTVEVARGQFAAALPRMEETVAALTAESASSWNFPAGLLLAQSYCALGHTRSRDEDAGGTASQDRWPRGSVRGAAAPDRGVAFSRARPCQRRDFASDGGSRPGQRALVSGRWKCSPCTTRPGLVTKLHCSGSWTSQKTSEGNSQRSTPRTPVALLTADAAKLYWAAEQFEAIGALLSAADAAAQAAALFKAADDRRRAVEAAATADRLATACGGVHTPALAEASQPLPLSTREREIANFVAEGLSNRDIAERLFVSTRTVEGHIYRACIKLDVSDREGLAIVIRQGRGS